MVCVPGFAKANDHSAGAAVIVADLTGAIETKLARALATMMMSFGQGLLRIG